MTLILDSAEIKNCVQFNEDLIPIIEDAFKSLASKYPERYGAKIGFDNKLAHLCAAGADFLCMPSRFEPCGLSQMYIMI